MDTDAQIPEGRRKEYEALIGLLLESASPDDARAPLVAKRVAQASVQPGHLWRAMELSDRAELRDLLETHFPLLAAGNTKDMRWKKYFYKKLCGWSGFQG